jgi:hypothetical protein
MPEVVRTAKNKLPPEKEVGKRRRPRVAGHIQTLGSLTTAKSRVIRGALPFIVSSLVFGADLVGKNIWA